MNSELEERGVDSPGIGEGRVGEPMARGKISLARAFYCCPMFLYFFCPTSVCIL
jgi:hypothetical protein